MDVRKNHSAYATLTSGETERCGKQETGDFVRKVRSRDSFVKEGKLKGGLGLGSGVRGGGDQSERQGRRGDMLPALQPAAVISCQVFTSLSVFC